jgi:hypothetical protein
MTLANDFIQKLVAASGDDDRSSQLREFIRRPAVEPARRSR